MGACNLAHHSQVTGHKLRNGGGIQTAINNHYSIDQTLFNEHSIDTFFYFTQAYLM